MKPDIGKLPKWAQEKINDMQREIDFLKGEYNRAANMVSGGKETSVVVEGHINCHDIYLPEGSRVSFDIEGSGYRQQITVGYPYHNGYDKSRLSISTNGNPLVIRPHVSNVIEISLDKR